MQVFRLTVTVRKPNGEPTDIEVDQYYIGKWAEYESWIGKLISKVYLKLDLRDFKSKFPNLKYGEAKIIKRPPGMFPTSIFSDHKAFLKGTYGIRIPVEDIDQYSMLKEFSIHGDSGCSGW